MNADSVKAIQKRKREYLKRFEEDLKRSKETEELGRKRAREELPSDDEAHSWPNYQQNPQKKTSNKRSKYHSQQKSIEEEIVTPKITEHGIRL